MSRLTEMMRLKAEELDETIGRAQSDEGLQEDLWDELLDDVLDAEVVTDLRGDYRGARVALTLGGPAIWLDTRRGTLMGSWGTESAEWGVSDRVRDFYHEAVQGLRRPCE